MLPSHTLRLAGNRNIKTGQIDKIGCGTCKYCEKQDYFSNELGYQGARIHCSNENCEPTTIRGRDFDHLCRYYEPTSAFAEKFADAWKDADEPVYITRLFHY